MPARRLLPIIVALASTIGLAACGSSSSDAPTAQDTTLGTGAAVPAAFDVQATLVGGGDFDLAAHAGRPVALWFWAPS
jgi:hypothetical protein